MKIMKASDHDRGTFFLLHSPKLRTEVIIAANECRKMFTPRPFNISGSSRSGDKKVSSTQQNPFFVRFGDYTKKSHWNSAIPTRWHEYNVNKLRLLLSTFFARVVLEEQEMRSPSIKRLACNEKKRKCGTEARVDNGEWQPVSEKGESIVLIKIQN